MMIMTEYQTPPSAAEIDDNAVDRFAAVMKQKMAAGRLKGRAGWATCPAPRLADMLIGHLTKTNSPTNYADIANFCMMLHQTGAKPNALADRVGIALPALTALASLAPLRDIATDELLHDSGCYFDTQFNDLTHCRHGDTGNYTNNADGQAIAILWNAWRSGAFDTALAPTLAALVIALEEALRPFANAADIKLCGHFRDDESISNTGTAFSVKFGDLRNARAALNQEAGE